MSDGATVSQRALFWPGPAYVRDKLERMLTQAGFRAFDTGARQVLGFYVNDLSALAGLLAENLTCEERQMTKTLLYDGAQPTLVDFGRVSRAEAVVLAGSSRWIAGMLADRRYKSLMQPIVAAESGTVYGYEFLFRGMEKNGDSVLPDVIIEAARQSGMLLELDRATHLSAVTTAARFGLGDHHLFINVMPTSVTDVTSGLAATFAAIEDAGLDPAHIVFEIVESQAVSDLDDLRTIIDAFRRLGYRIALDDFGSGFNNLTTLASLEPDFLKLDKALITQLTFDANLWHLVANMIDAAKHGEVEVIAEGVEDEDVARTLTTLGADYLQGYLFGIPSDRPRLGEPEAAEPVRSTASA